MICPMGPFLISILDHMIFHTSICFIEKVSLFTVWEGQEINGENSWITPILAAVRIITFNFRGPHYDFQTNKRKLY